MNLSFVVFLAYSKKDVPFWVFVVLSALVLISIFFGATRKAFGAWIILVLFYILGKYNLRDPKKIIMIILIGFAGYYFIDYVMENTIVGLRMNMIEDASSR